MAVDDVHDVIDREDVVVVVALAEVQVRVASLRNLRVGAVVGAQSEQVAVVVD